MMVMPSSAASMLTMALSELAVIHRRGRYTDHEGEGFRRITSHCGDAESLSRTPEYALPLPIP